MKHTLAYVILGALFLGAPLTLFAEGGESSLPVSAGIAIQQEVGVAELDVKNVGTLPTSKFYFLKEWKRGVSKFFTFSEVKKTALMLRITNEKLAEALAVEEASPADALAFREALENYSESETALEARMLEVRGYVDDEKAKELFVLSDKQSVVRATLLTQVAQRWQDDPYSEDASRASSSPEMIAEREAIMRVIKETQSTQINAWAAVFEKRGNGEAEAETQLTRAESEFNLLKAEVAKLEADIMAETAFAIKEQGIRMAPLHSGLEAGFNTETAIAIREQGVRNAEIAIDEPGVGRVDKTRESDASAGDKQTTGTTRIDNTPPRISTNLTIERQTPKRDFGDRMKAGLGNAGGMLAQGKTAFAEKKFGEAFGHARSAEMLAVSMRRAIAEYAIKEQGVKSVSPLYEDKGKEVENPLHDAQDQIIKACHPSATETCDEGSGSERPVVTTPAKAEPNVITLPALPVACTEEAKMCPDGTSVGRSGPRCEFSACPELKPTGMMCTAQYDPVCGVDGKTYGNSCEAESAGVRVVSKGECGASVQVGEVRSSESR